MEWPRGRRNARLWAGRHTATAAATVFARPSGHEPGTVKLIFQPVGGRHDSPPRGWCSADDQGGCPIKSETRCDLRSGCEPRPASRRHRMSVRPRNGRLSFALSANHNWIDAERRAAKMGSMTIASPSLLRSTDEAQATYLSASLRAVAGSSVASKPGRAVRAQ